MSLGWRLPQPIEGRRRFKGTLLGLRGDVVKLRLDDGQETDVPLSVVTGPSSR